jgi:hypothetical protein
MKVFQWRKNLYAVSSATLQVPLASRVNANQSQWTDPDGVPHVQTDAATTTFVLTIPWFKVVKFNPEAGIADIESLFL